MKKVFLGASMFLAGLVSCAILLAGTVGTQWTHNGDFASAWWLLSKYGIMPVFWLCAIITVIGLVVAVAGVIEK